MCVQALTLPEREKVMNRGESFLKRTYVGSGVMGARVVEMWGKSMDDVEERSRMFELELMHELEENA